MQAALCDSLVSRIRKSSKWSALKIIYLFSVITPREICLPVIEVENREFKASFDDLKMLHCNIIPIKALISPLSATVDNFDALAFS